MTSAPAFGTKASSFPDRLRHSRRARVRFLIRLPVLSHRFPLPQGIEVAPFPPRISAYKPYPRPRETPPDLPNTNPCPLPSPGNTRPTYIRVHRRTRSRTNMPLPPDSTPRPASAHNPTPSVAADRLTASDRKPTPHPRTPPGPMPHTTRPPPEAHSARTRRIPAICPARRTRTDRTHGTDPLTVLPVLLLRSHSDRRSLSLLYGRSPDAIFFGPPLCFLPTFSQRSTNIAPISPPTFTTLK